MKEKDNGIFGAVFKNFNKDNKVENLLIKFETDEEKQKFAEHINNTAIHLNLEMQYNHDIKNTHVFLGMELGDYNEPAYVLEKTELLNSGIMSLIYNDKNKIHYSINFDNLLSDFLNFSMKNII